VGVDHDTAEFAVETIKRWWIKWENHFILMRKNIDYCDGGGSNSSRSRLWKKELQKLSMKQA